MPVARISSNTTKDYPCTMCGSSGNIVREDAINPRLKCNECGFMYNGEDSLAAKEAGRIPDGPPDIPEESFDQADQDLKEGKAIELTSAYADNLVTNRLPLAISLPRTPTHVLLSKDRRDFEFVTKRTLRKEVLKWTAGSRAFDLFELTLKKVDAKVEIN